MTKSFDSIRKTLSAAWTSREKVAPDLGQGSIAETFLIAEKTSPQDETNGDRDGPDDGLAQPERDQLKSEHVHENENDRVAPLPHDPLRPRAMPPRHLLNLPHELLLDVFLRLNLSDLVMLRRTCKTLHNLAHPNQIRRLLGKDAYNEFVSAHCIDCLQYFPARDLLLPSRPADRGYPLASKCVPCAMRDPDNKQRPRFRIGASTKLANLDDAWTCRWCGWPVCTAAALRLEDPGAELEGPGIQFHSRCFRKYRNIVLTFMLLGWVQMGLSFTSSALAWRFFRQEIVIFAPATTSFLLAWIQMGFIIFRSAKRFMYWWTLSFEVVILGLWIFPIYRVAMFYADQGWSTALACLVVWSMLMFFRFLNVVGHVLVLSEYDLTKRHNPTCRRWTKLFIHPVLAAFVYWTYPRHVALINRRRR